MDDLEEMRARLADLESHHPDLGLAEIAKLREAIRHREEQEKQK